MSELDTAFNSTAKERGQDGADLFNLVTKVVLLEEVEHDLCNQSAIGFKLFTVFVKERIQTGKEDLWSPITNKKKTEAAHMENHKKEDQGDCWQQSGGATRR